MPRIAGVLYGVKPVVIAIVVQALWILDVPTTLFVVFGAITLIRFKVNTTWIVGAGGVLGTIVTALR